MLVGTGGLGEIEAASNQGLGVGDGGVDQRRLPGGMTPKLRPHVGMRVGHATEGVWVAGMQQVVLLHAEYLGKGVKL